MKGLKGCKRLKRLKGLNGHKRQKRQESRLHETRRDGLGIGWRIHRAAILVRFFKKNFCLS